MEVQVIKTPEAETQTAMRGTKTPLKFSRRLQILQRQRKKIHLSWRITTP